MKKELIIASVGIVLTLLIVSAVAQEISKTSTSFVVEKIKEQIQQEFQKMVGANATTSREVMEKMVRGEVKLNITPHLPPLPVFPPIECPSFMVVELPFKPYIARAHQYVMKYLHEKNLTLPQVCADKTKLEALVREAVEKVNLTKVCKGLEKASEHCKEVKPLDCERIKNAIPPCVEGLKKCKLAEERVKIAKEAWKEKIEEVEEEVEAQEEAVEKILEEGSSEVEVPVVIVPPSPPVPKIEGIIPKCYIEEHVCEQLKEKYEKCLEFQEKCAPRCEVIDRLTSECVAALADKETLIRKVVEFLSKQCELIGYVPPVEEVENETIAPAEIQPVIIVTKPLTPEQETRIKTLVEKLEQIYKDETWMYRAFVRANKIEDLRELEFVLTVKIDHIMRALQRGAFKKLPELPEFAPKVEKVLPALEGVKAKVEAELQPVVTEAEIEILNHTKEITAQHKEEKARGIGYRILKFLGLQASQEIKDATFLEEKARSIGKVVENLKNIAKTEERPEIKAIILEQVAELQKSIDEISARANAKRKGAFGIWSLLGLR